MGSGTPSVRRKLSWVMMSTAPTGATFIFMVPVTQEALASREMITIGSLVFRSSFYL